MSLVRYFAVEESIELGKKLSWSIPDELSKLIEIEQAQEILQREARCQARMINWSLQLARAESNDYCCNTKEDSSGINEISGQVAAPSATFHSRLRSALLANLTRSIVELYQLCDEEEDILVCSDAISLFARGGRDFNVLSDRLNERRRAGIDQNSAKHNVAPESVSEQSLHSSGSRSNINAGNHHESETKTAVTLQRVYSPDKWERSKDEPNNQQTPILRDRSIDVAYASYIRTNLEVNTEKGNSNDLSVSSEKKRAINYDNGDDANGNSHMYFDQRLASQPHSRHSTLRAAAAPFQPSVSVSISTGQRDSDRGEDLSDLIRATSSSDEIAGQSDINSSSRRSAVSAGPSDNSQEVKSTADTDGKAKFVRKVSSTLLDPPTTSQLTKLKQPRQHELVRDGVPSPNGSNKDASGRGKMAFATVSTLAQADMRQKKEAASANSIDTYAYTYSGFMDPCSPRVRWRNSDRGREEREAAMEAEVSEASEHVWRQVEKWIEAEAMAEEAAWDVLALGHDNDNEDNANDNEEEERYVGDESDFAEEDFAAQTVDLDSDSVTHSSPLHPTLQSIKSLAINHSHHDEKLVVIENNAEEPLTPSLLESANNLSELSSPSLSHAVSNMPSTAATITCPPSVPNAGTRSESPAQQTINRFLHAKLSSPDRRRAISPVEAKKRQEAKQHSAESNRDKTVAERRQKALLVSDRVKTRGINEQKRLNLAEVALEERLRDAEKRHEECIKVIKLRAGNENTKVSEVMFINNMNAEGIVDQLRQKLVEVEARVLAAAIRRQDILSGITARQRKRNNKKVQQMSEMRLQLERQKMERWDKLQRRLEAVQFRRQARFKEMQRRSDAQELTRARLASSSFLKDTSSADGVSISGVKTAVASLDSLASTMSLLRAQLTAPPITPTDDGTVAGKGSKDIDKDKEKEKEKALSISVTAAPYLLSSSKSRQASSNTGISVNVNVNKSDGSKAVTSPLPIKNADYLSTSSKGRKVSPSLSLSGPPTSKMKAASSTIRPFTTSLKSPSVSGAAGFFDNSSTSMKVPAKVTAGNVRGNTNEGGRGFTASTLSQPASSHSFHLDSQQQRRPSASQKSNESDSDKKNRSACSGPVTMELREDSPVPPSFSRTTSRSGSVAESAMGDSGSCVLGGTTGLKKKKRKGKKKEKASEADEEMLLLDALLTAQQQLQDIDMGKNTSAPLTSISKRDCQDVVIMLHAGVASKWFGTEGGVPRPRLNKQLNLFSKSLKRKKAAAVLRDTAIERGPLVYTSYLACVKAKGVPSSEGHGQGHGGVSEGSVHGLMKYVCERSPALLAEGVQCINEEPQKGLAISMVKDVLGRMESATGDERKETGLFLKQGGGYLLRVLIGDELGLLSNRQDSPLGSIDDSACNGLLMLVCRALAACTSTPGARDTIFSAGLAYYVADLVVVISGHLVDWLASHWSNRQAQEHGSCTQVMWPEESQVLPLLLSTLTRLLKHVTAIFNQSHSKSKKPSALRQSESWLRYFFASGAVPSLCRAIRSLQPHQQSVREEALPHLLLYSLVDCVGSLSRCITAADNSNVTSESLLSADIVLLSPHDSSSPDPVSSAGALSSSTRKEMISMLRDLQLVPSLALSLNSLLKPVGAVNSTARQTSVRMTDAPAVRTASVFSMAGLIVETLAALAVTDIGLLQCQVSCPRPSGAHTSNPSGDSNIHYLGSNGPSSLKMEGEDAWCPSRESQLQVASLLGASCGLLMNSLMALLETNAALLKEGAASASSTAYLAGPSLLSTCSRGVSQSRDLMIHFRAVDADSCVQCVLSLLDVAGKQCPALARELTGEGEGCSDTLLLSSLFGMPDRYYTVEKFRSQLLPALQSLHRGREQQLEDRVRARGMTGNTHHLQ